MRMVLLGAPGAGKGTQAERLSEKYGWPHVATGDIFRAALAEGTELGLLAKGYMDKGELVPDEVVERIVFERLDADDCRDGFILDGFPRSVHQAEALDAYLEGKGARLDLVLDVEVEPEVLVERLTGRRVCRECGANAHELFMPPREPGVCDDCGGELYQRGDDNEETVRNRLEVYARQTEPLIEYYRGRNLVTIEGDAAPEEVLGEICGAVDAG